MHELEKKKLKIQWPNYLKKFKKNSKLNSRKVEEKNKEYELTKCKTNVQHRKPTKPKVGSLARWINGIDLYQNWKRKKE